MPTDTDTQDLSASMRIRYQSLQPHTAAGLALDWPDRKPDEAINQAREICDCYGLNATECVDRGAEHPMVRYIAPVLRAKDAEIARLRDAIAGARQVLQETGKP